MNLISLKLKCPSCGKSLMDESQLVDNSPSINLKIKIDGNNGDIWLSSVYESYNYSCNINVPKDKIAEFSCPHCEASIDVESQCNTCGAGTANLHLFEGGIVSFCRRSGCKDHHVEFDRISAALKKFHHEFSYAGKYSQEESIFKKSKGDKTKEKDDTKEILETGSYLQSYCPHCKKSLIEDNMIKFSVKADESGYIMLSPYLNVFTTKSTIFLKEQAEVSEICCPHCEKSLKVSKKCDDCGSPVAKILISARTKLIDFYLCSKKGCRWHGLNNEDLYEIKLEDSLEW